jgi:hypothetical protein
MFVCVFVLSSASSVRVRLGLARRSRLARAACILTRTADYVTMSMLMMTYDYVRDPSVDRSCRVVVVLSLSFHFKLSVLSYNGRYHCMGIEGTQNIVFALSFVYGSGARFHFW